MTPEIGALLQAVAGLLTFGAAAWAVVAAYRAPKLAAEFAEQLRREHAQGEAVQREKQWIMATLMRNRSQMLHLDVVAALNMIDVTFIDSKDVREAFQQYWNAINTDTPVALKRERFNKIIEAMVRDLGLGEKIRMADIERSYLPSFFWKRVEIELAETEIRWHALYNDDGSPRPLPKPPSPP